MMTDNNKIAGIFHKMADLLEIKGENAFRIRAFRRVAQSLENLSESAKTLLETNRLQNVPGIGSGSLSRLEEIIKTGTCQDLITLEQDLPPGLFDLLEITGLGPKKVKLFYEALNISSVEELAAAAKANELQKLPRMGKKSEEKILHEIQNYQRRVGRIPLGDALIQGEKLLAALKDLKCIEAIELAGSVRRGKETIGDLDILVASEKPIVVMDRFIQLPDISEVMLRGDTKCSVRITSGLQVDLRVLKKESFGAALHYFTGSQMHNIAIRDRAKRRNFRVNEYGIFKEPSGERIGGAEENDIFKILGLNYIPAELRENRGEIEAAENNTLPQLITDQDILADFHLRIQSNEEAEKLIRSAQQLSLKTLVFTPTLSSLQKLDQQKLNSIALELDISIIWGLEVLLSKSGISQEDSEAIKNSAWTVAKIDDNAFNADEDITSLVLTLFDQGMIDALSRPSGRIIGLSNAYRVDVDKIIKAAAEQNIVLELNSDPRFLDLDANRLKQAKDIGIKIAISSAANILNGYQNLRFGIKTARRGWIEANDCLNSLTPNDLREWIKK